MLRTLVPAMLRPPRPAGGFDREVADWMERFFGPERGAWLRELEEFRPTTNVAETEKGYEVTVDLPGVKPEEVTLEMRDGELWITGEKKEEKEEKGKTFHRVERTFGRFQRVVPLPAAVAEDRIEATCKDGVLKVVLPKTLEVRPRPIEVRKQ